MRVGRKERKQTKVKEKRNKFEKIDAKMENKDKVKENNFKLRERRKIRKKFLVSSWKIRPSAW